MIPRNYCKACLLEQGELSAVYTATIQNGRNIYACPLCKREDAGFIVDSYKLLEILWAAAGMTSTQRMYLQECAKHLLTEIQGPMHRAEVATRELVEETDCSKKGSLKNAEVELEE